MGGGQKEIGLQNAIRCFVKVQSKNVRSYDYKFGQMLSGHLFSSGSKMHVLKKRNGDINQMSECLQKEN